VLRGLWGLSSLAAFDEEVAFRTLQSHSTWVRAWTVRLLGEKGQVSAQMLAQLGRLAAGDPAPEVRSQLAGTAGLLKQQDTLPLLHFLMSHKEDAGDPNIPLMIWLAYEPRTVANQQGELEWLGRHAGGNSLIVDEIV